MAPGPLDYNLVAASALSDAQFDAVVVIAAPGATYPANLQCIKTALDEHSQIDKKYDEGEVTIARCDQCPSKRLVYCGTGPVNRDYDDVRRFYNAGVKAMKRCIESGSKAPLLVCRSVAPYEKGELNALLGAMESAYVPLEVKEMCPDKQTKITTLGYLGDAAVVEDARVLEAGRKVARDIGGSDPERMAPPKVREYVEQVFAGTVVKVSVEADPEVIEKEYPMMAAVNRGCKGIKRHLGCAIFLDYEGEGPTEKTLMLVGKGVTFDTGGVNIKVGSAMNGMHRDKCGSAFVAGFFQVLAQYKPKNLKVRGVMCMVRNSVGEEAYICDEIIVSRAGKRCRIVNTDAEGRMAMCDLLCLFKEQAVNEVNPELFTIATLTGHVIRAYGMGCSAICQNGPAANAKVGETLQATGDVTGDAVEISRMKYEDYDAHRGETQYEDLMQSAIQPSTMTNRGHQTPAAFLIMASGLDKHGIDSDQQLKYAHLDIAGAAGVPPHIATGAPVVAMASNYVLCRPRTQ